MEAAGEKKWMEAGGKKKKKKWRMSGSGSESVRGRIIGLKKRKEKFNDCE